MSEMKGLVLEGGGFRGMYTCGVIDVFMENGICFDEVVGLVLVQPLVVTSSQNRLVELFVIINVFVKIQDILV